jgi:UDP-N-acetylglucosamine 2-epimerase (non-hydrolysing)
VNLQFPNEDLRSTEDMKNLKSKIINRKLKVLSVFGTRPEAVKMAPVVQRLAQTPGIDSRVCVTAQHRQMLDQVLSLFGIQPDYDLDLMRDDQPLAELSAGIFTHLDPILAELEPDWVLAQGDTTTVAITSLLAYYHRIKFGHVEAGLRTHDKWQPYPEEINRRVAGVIADLHFAPTQQAKQNLLHEGIPNDAIFVTGNPVIDALQFVAEQPAPDEVKALLSELEIGDRKLVLVTAHRRENFGKPLENICLALKRLAERGDVEIVYPVHLNPNVQGPVKRILGDEPHVTLLPPLDYLPLVHLQKWAKIILTDSGGIQEEAPAFGVPVLVLREVTERPEGIEAGTLKLVGTDKNAIVREANRLLDNPAAHAEMAKAVNPFGDGHATERIIDALRHFSPVSDL